MVEANAAQEAKKDDAAAEEKEMTWKSRENTHGNIIYVCFGGMSNTGITAALAGMGAIKELGLENNLK